MKNILKIFAFSFISLSTVAQTPTLTASATKVCVGEPVRITATGCSQKVVWTSGKTGSSILDTLQQTTTYNAVCMEGENIIFSYASVEVVAVEKPQTPYLFCNGDIIKKGETVSVKTFGCDGIVTWSNGTVGREIAVSPVKTTTYTAICTNETGCSAEPISRTIIVEGDSYGNLTPNISWRYGCEGEDIIMTANGCTAGVYVWYQNTLYNNNILRSDEIGRGNSVEVNQGGEGVFYTARCQFLDCLGDESNRLFIGYTKNIVAPTVTKDLAIDASNPAAVDLSLALGKPNTSNGVYEYHESASATSPIITNPKAISKAGTYYVLEKSRLGNCSSGLSPIVVKLTTDPQDVLNNQPLTIATPIEDTKNIYSEETTQAIQSTDIGATISSVEPNADLSDLQIAEGFSPNGDGANDTFVIKNLGTHQASLRVYNRYGHMVYSAENYKNDWNGNANTGMYKNSKIGLTDGTYYYVLQLEDGRQKISFLTLMR